MEVLRSESEGLRSSLNAVCTIVVGSRATQKLSGKLRLPASRPFAK
jgi:hypothetical protein